MSNFNKKIGEIETVQSRIATGSMQGGQTKIWMYNGEFGLDGTANKAEALDYAKYGVPLAGYYIVHHSPIMAGNWDEIVIDFVRIIKNAMMRAGLAKSINVFTDLAII